MVKLFKHSVFLLLLLGLFSSACTSQTGRSYRAGETREAQTVHYGVITNLSNDVVIEDEPTGLGTVAGGLLGGIVGSAFGGGTGKIFTVVGGALAGGVAGTMAESSLRTKKAQEITIDLDSGDSIVVVQEIDKQEMLYVGDSVKVLSSPNGAARVRLR